MIERNQAVAIFGSQIFGAAAIYLFRLAGLTDGFLHNLLSKTIASSMTEIPLLDTSYLIAGILALAISFAFVGIYALITQKMDWTLAIAGVIMIPVSLLFIGMSMTGAVFGAGLFLSTIILQYLPIDDAKAYKELRPARIVRGAVGSSILMLSILVGLSVLFVLSEDAAYANNGTNEIIDTIMGLTIDSATRASVEEVPGGMDMLKNEMASSQIILMIKTYYAQISAITAFTTFQVIGIVLAPIAGIIASILWKLQNN